MAGISQDLKLARFVEGRSPAASGTVIWKPRTLEFTMTTYLANDAAPDGLVTSADASSSEMERCSWSRIVMASCTSCQEVAVNPVKPRWKPPDEKYGRKRVSISSGWNRLG